MKISRLLLGLSAGLLMAVALVPKTVSASDVNNFSFRSFEADYYLTRDANKHSHLRVEEHLVAEFPSNQNHGIERAIPNSYDGHNLHLKIESVTDENGQRIKYKKRTSNGNTVLRIGDANKYVYGERTYNITYDFKDVTKSFEDHDEIFWNTNGTQWVQSFDKVSAHLHLDKTVTDLYAGKNRCLMGRIGSTESCNFSAVTANGETTINFASTRQLDYGENLSFVTAFKKGSFAAYEPTSWERIFPTLVAIWLIMSGALLVAMIVLSVWLYRRYGRAEPGKGTIVPEYLPPRDSSVLIAGNLLRKTRTAPTAQLIDLAVRHYLKIYEVQEKRLFGPKRSYEVELIKDPAGLSSEEHSFLDTVYGASILTVGVRATTKDIGKNFQKSLQSFLAVVDDQAQEAGYYADRKMVKSRYNKLGLLLLAASIVTFSPGFFIGVIIWFIIVNSLKPLSGKGSLAVEYLEGLKMYMQLAEADRLQTLQSPEGAEKLPAGTDPNDKRQLVKLYEHLLPYAVLYGIEKQWIKQFAGLYEQAPDWYAGDWDTFNAVVFASSLSSFSSASNTVFAPPSSSGSSGFSGGSSGGGGGGGGGGGW